jgi:hypothetical protein
MLGSVAEAEEVVQDAWLRWHEADKASFDSAEAWLVTVVTRLSIDRLRAAKVQREHYIGTWLPEPTLTDSPARPSNRWSAPTTSPSPSSPCSSAWRRRRAPPSCCARCSTPTTTRWRTLGKSEAACRQLVHRAKAQVQDARPRYQVSRETHQRLLRAFADAAARGSMQDLKALLAETSNSSATAAARCRPSARCDAATSAWRSSTFALAPHGPGGAHGAGGGQRRAGLLRFIDGELESAQTFEIEDERIARIRVQRNPGQARAHRADRCLEIVRAACHRADGWPVFSG